jgi:hypothetical protein
MFPSLTELITVNIFHFHAFVNIYSYICIQIYLILSYICSKEGIFQNKVIKEQKTEDSQTTCRMPNRL